jgi:C-terminal processing protease CtpA/Prc
MRISEIVEGSVADRSGALSVGDKIVLINHQIIANCAVQEALSILHSSADTITLQIEKNYDNDGECKAGDERWIECPKFKRIVHHSTAPDC